MGGTAGAIPICMNTQTKQKQTILAALAVLSMAISFSAMAETNAPIANDAIKVTNRTGGSASVTVLDSHGMTKLVCLRANESITFDGYAPYETVLISGRVHGPDDCSPGYYSIYQNAFPKGERGLNTEIYLQPDYYYGVRAL